MSHISKLRDLKHILRKEWLSTAPQHKVFTGNLTDVASVITEVRFTSALGFRLLYNDKRYDVSEQEKYSISTVKPPVEGLSLKM